jgi:hypothetical protein
MTTCVNILPCPTPAPDGTLRGREILLALYVHVAHHRGQAEVYLRDKGINPLRSSFELQGLRPPAAERQSVGTRPSRVLL